MVGVAMPKFIFNEGLKCAMCTCQYSKDDCLFFQETAL